MAKGIGRAQKVFQFPRRRGSAGIAETTRGACGAVYGVDDAVSSPSRPFASCARPGQAPTTRPQMSGEAHKLSCVNRSVSASSLTLFGMTAFSAREICQSGAPPGYSPVGSSIAKKEHLAASPANDCIEIRGARQNNLKGIDVDLPLGKLTVITGPSGSGKSSLAFQTIYAEGQRRYVETFSPYMRQFLDRMDKPRVDDIRGIPPAIAIEQSNPVKSSRSTVGTMTEINDYLKLLWPRVARGFCPSCSREIRPETTKSIADQVLYSCAEKIVLVTFWVAVPPQTEPRKFFEFLQKQGYLRIWVDNEIVRVDAEPKIKRIGARVQVIQDRIAISKENHARLVA